MKETSESQDKLNLLKASQGNAEAFSLLFDKYSRKIYRFIFYKVSNPEVAEDLASQCFLRVWEQISTGQKIKKLKYWLYRVARNLVVDYYRSRQKEELPLIYSNEQLEAEVSEINPNQELELKLLEKLVFTLKTEAREIVVLRYIEEMSIKEISKIVDKSPANIRVIIHRALKELQKYISS